jgi:maltose-binding protein MalE
MTFYMPLRRNALEHEALQEQFAKFPGLEAVYAQLDYATVEPQIPEWFEIRKYLEERVIERVLRGQVRPKKALDDLANTMKEMLATK